MTKSTAKELASRGITVNAVAPGFIETEMTEVLSDKLKEEMRGQIPLARMGQPEDVAKAVAFLASDHASYITGQVLQVDGDGDVKMVAEKVEGQIVQKMSFKFRLANHSDEPLKPRIVSAKASTIL